MRLPLLILHILAGTVGLLSGTFAIAVRKGSRLHRASGNVFTVAMLTLASSALWLAIMESQHGNIIGSIITYYMITTAWLAALLSYPCGCGEQIDVCLMPSARPRWELTLRKGQASLSPSI